MLPNLSFFPGPVARKFDAGAIPEDERHLSQPVEAKDIPVRRRLGLFGHFPGTRFYQRRSCSGVMKFNPPTLTPAPAFTAGALVLYRAGLMLLADAFELLSVHLLIDELACSLWTASCSAPRPLLLS